MTEDHTERVVEAIGDRYDVARVEPLATLDHSYVASVRLGDGTALVFKQAGAPQFAPGICKELVVNRDVLAQLHSRIAPAMVSSDADGERPWMLFEDIGATHAAIALATPPSLAHVRAFVSTLARIHAQTAALELEPLFRDVHGDVRVTDGGEAVAEVLDAFLAGDEIGQFPPRVRELVARLRDRIPALRDGLDAGLPVLVHGDAHFGNAMYRVGEDGDVDALLLDWALAVIGPGEVDLAHALAMNLPRLHGSEYEMEMLAEYVRVCAEHGLSRRIEDVRQGYRLGLLSSVIVSVGMQQVPGMSPTIWSHVLTNAVHATLQHDAAELLG